MQKLKWNYTNAENKIEFNHLYNRILNINRGINRRIIRNCYGYFERHRIDVFDLLRRPVKEVNLEH